MLFVDHLGLPRPLVGFRDSVGCICKSFVDKCCFHVDGPVSNTMSIINKLFLLFHSSLHHGAPF